MIYYLFLVLLLLFYEIDFLINFSFRHKWLYTLTRYVYHITNFKKQKMDKPAMLNGISNGMIIMLFWSYLFIAFIISSVFFLPASTFYTCSALILVPNIIKSYTLKYNIKYFKMISILETLINIVVFGYIFVLNYAPIFAKLFV